jgi:hypothetical protein
MKHPEHTYEGFVSAISEQDMTRSPRQPPPLTQAATATVGDNPLTDVAAAPAPPAAPPAPPPPSAFSPSSDISRWHLRLGLGLRQREEDGRHTVGRAGTGRV